MAKTIIVLTGSKSKLIYEPLPTDDPTHRKPHIEMAKEELGWEPKEDLRHTIDYFKDLL